MTVFGHFPADTDVGGGFPRRSVCAEARENRPN
jgi:hypothetical protein